MQDDPQTLLLIQKARAGDQRAFERLLNDITPYLRAVCRRYTGTGLPMDDMMQEARLGVWQALETWTPDKSSWRGYAAYTVAARKVHTLAATARRLKHQMLSNCLRLDAVTGEEEDTHQALTIAGIVAHPDPTPEEALMDKAAGDQYRILLPLLTPLEKRILGDIVAHGGTYAEVADRLNIKSKTIDNALLRVRQKARCLFIGEQG